MKRTSSILGICEFALIFLLILSNMYFFNKWTTAEARPVETKYITLPATSFEYDYEGALRNSTKKYLKFLHDQAEKKDCEAIYLLWQYYNIGVIDQAQSDYYLKLGVDSGCTATVFLKHR